MSYAPFDTGLVIARLRTAVTQLRHVAGAAEYAAVKSLRDYVTPSAYVLMAQETAGERAPYGLKAQPAVAQFGVALALRNYREQLGEQLVPQLRDLVGQVRSALIGWQPSAPGGGPCLWEGGSVMDYDDATILWVDVYSCSHVLQR